MDQLKLEGYLFPKSDLKEVERGKSHVVFECLGEIMFVALASLIFPEAFVFKFIPKPPKFYKRKSKEKK
jgi:hypothetical protein